MHFGLRLSFRRRVQGPETRASALAASGAGVNGLAGTGAR